MGEMMTISELARYLNVNRRTLYRLAQDGKVPGFKVGGTWRFDKKDIEEWIADQKRNQGSNQSELAGGLSI